MKMGYEFQRVENAITAHVRVTYNGIGVGSFEYDQFGGAAAAMKAAKSFVHDRLNPVDPMCAIRDAMQDLLLAPKGVVPASCEEFYDIEKGHFSTTKVADFLEQ